MLSKLMNDMIIIKYAVNAYTHLLILMLNEIEKIRLKKILYFN